MRRRTSDDLSECIQHTDKFVVRGVRLFVFILGYVWKIGNAQPIESTLRMLRFN